LKPARSPGKSRKPAERNPGAACFPRPASSYFSAKIAGAFAAADAKSGKLLWHFQASENWKASPMTFMAGGKQYVAIAAGANVLAFALP